MTTLTSDVSTDDAVAPAECETNPTFVNMVVRILAKENVTAACVNDIITEYTKLVAHTAVCRSPDTAACHSLAAPLRYPRTEHPHCALAASRYS